MKSERGRLILRDGTEVPLEHRRVALKDGSKYHGVLLGDLSDVDATEYAYKLRYISAEGSDLALSAMTFSDGYLTFISDPDNFQDRNWPTALLHSSG
ncbi:hypothetical protein [Bosea sp. BK604]|uniref:hypothetical protein n=1 Tax=Bosea sp. BK604 TaxID=2512180 RepID=UPI0010441D7B|nr:hypothetical protein [Bosea sp. BK604]